MKKKTKNYLVLTLIVIMILALPGCGNVNVTLKPEESKASSEEETETEETKYMVNDEDALIELFRGVDKVKILKGAKNVDLAKYMEQVLSQDDEDKAKVVKTIEVDDSKLNMKKAGEYEVTYSVTVEPEAFEKWKTELIRTYLKDNSVDMNEVVGEDDTVIKFTVNVAVDTFQKIQNAKDSHVLNTDNEVVKDDAKATEAPVIEVADEEDETSESGTTEETEKEITKATETKKATETTKETKKQKETTTSSTTTAQETTVPPTTAHQHTWVNEKVLVRDAWDEQVVTQPAWDEQVLVKDAWDEQVVIQAAWDEQVVTKNAWDEQVVTKAAWDETVTNYVQECHDFCEACGMDFTASGVDTEEFIGEHMEAHILSGESSCWYDQWINVPVTTTIHHDAEYNIVHHDAEYKTVHHDAVMGTVRHDAEYKTVHHDAVLKPVHHDAEYTTVTKCSTCGDPK